MLLPQPSRGFDRSLVIVAFGSSHGAIGHLMAQSAAPTPSPFAGAR
jgi:hypothetical protein